MSNFLPEIGRFFSYHLIPHTRLFILPGRKQHSGKEQHTEKEILLELHVVAGNSMHFLQPYGWKQYGEPVCVEKLAETSWDKPGSRVWKEQVEQRAGWACLRAGFLGQQRRWMGAWWRRFAAGRAQCCLLAESLNNAFNNIKKYGASSNQRERQTTLSASRRY